MKSWQNELTNWPKFVHSIQHTNHLDDLPETGAIVQFCTPINREPIFTCMHPKKIKLRETIQINNCWESEQLESVYLRVFFLSSVCESIGVYLSFGKWGFFIQILYSNNY